MSSHFSRRPGIRLIFIRRGLAAFLIFWGANCPGQSTPQTDPVAGRATTSERVVLPKSVPDPLEPLNRVIWTFNRGVLVGLVKPTARVYRAVVRKPIRTGISNFGRNVMYPGRLINNLLQRRWSGARSETDRFLCNTIIGGGGFVDVATRLNISKSEADFGETLGRWGWKPRCYLMLPIYGPSNERDAIGLATDTAANPFTYITPYPVDPRKPLTFFSPYTYYSYGITYNNLVDSVDSYVRFSTSEKDPYAMLQYAWTFNRDPTTPDFRTRGEPDEASLQTLQTVLFTVKNPEFPSRGKTRSVSIPATGQRLKFTFWLQPGTAPLVYIVPGLGSHRLSETVVALAELVYGQGYSAVCLSSAYNHEFMENASSAAMPAYTPVDVHDLHVACSQIHRRLQERYPGRLGARALLGYSMGGFHTLFVAATEATNQAPLITFDRYVAINAPPRLLYGVAQLDDFYRAPLAWPAAERTQNLRNVFRKVAALIKTPPTAQSAPPFDAIESKFLVAVAFRFILRDMIYSSQERHNQGVLRKPIDELRREPVYREIMQYSYADYLEKFLLPYYQTRGIDLAQPEALQKASDLRIYADELRANSKVRLIVNRNDILLAPEDLAWLEAAFDTNRLTIFEKGGHLGNLAYPEVQKAILGALEGLKPGANSPDKGRKPNVRAQTVR